MSTELQFTLASMIKWLRSVLSSLLEPIVSQIKNSTLSNVIILALTAFVVTLTNNFSTQASTHSLRGEMLQHFQDIRKDLAEMRKDRRSDCSEWRRHFSSIEQDRRVDRQEWRRNFTSLENRMSRVGIS
ncbi:hypothetical protein MMC20_005761 [Loxospora ochrophaea]|nr:hypothetical protein [Loxospora ochrophaea]